jgi:hypothetical protein
MLGLYDLEFLLGKWLSVKVLINKEESRVCWEFLKCGENKNWE